MSKRWYLCDIIGTGTDDDPIRPAVADHGVAWAGAVRSDVSAWALVLVATPNHAKLRNIDGIDGLPDVPFDLRMNAINTAASQALSAALSRRGIAVQYGGTDGYRDVVRAIGQKLDATFVEDGFDILER